MNAMIFIASFTIFLPLVFSYSFTVDYENNCFLKDGEPFRYVSGSIHYFRVPWQYWGDRIEKMKMAGLNAIQTYVEWNHHEPEPGVYNFHDNYNLPKFLQTAKDLGMLVVLRAGPFIDAERDMGGLPYWLLRIDPNMQLRTYDEKYIKYVDRWYSVLLPLIEPFLYAHGGPIITIQIENEYGSVGLCDAHYKSHLRNFFKHYLKNRVVLFTTDGCQSNVLSCGKTDEVFSTVDFGTGSNASTVFELLRWHQASGPLVNSEFYPGWLDHWGEPHANVSSQAIVETLTNMLQKNASVNMYMFHGGTSFGFSAGSNLASTFQACPTSYDYDAPLSEAGDPTQKYYDIRNVVGKFLPLPPGPIPEPSPKMELKPIAMSKIASVWDYISISSTVVMSPYPLSFEDLKHPYGYVVYRATINFLTSDPSVLSVPDIRDRGYVYVNKVLQGILSREQKIYSIPVRVYKGEEITILVENQGRVCAGSSINDRKGIFQNVTLGTKQLLNWTMVPVNLDAGFTDILDVGKWKSDYANTQEQFSHPSFYNGNFIIQDDEIFDTFLRLDGWHKGVAFLNGINLGRYWPMVGPQVTLYVPGVFFRQKPEINVITLLEVEKSPCHSSASCYIKFVKKPVVNGKTPSNVEVLPNFYGKKFLRENIIS